MVCFEVLAGNNNLRWRGAGISVPNNRFIVLIIDDDIPEPVEIVVECDDTENCYLPRQTYTIYHRYK